MTEIASIRNYRYDVLILGGGPAGLAAALSLHESGLTVAVIEKSNYESFRVGETLLPEGRLPLEQLGLWDEFLSGGHTPADGICSCWGSAEPGYYDFIANPYGPGWHLDRRCLDATLAGVAAARGVALFTSTQPVNYEPGADGYTVQVRRQGQERFALQASLLIDASGRRAAMAGVLKVKRLLFDQLIGIYGFFKVPTEDTVDSYTLIEAWAEGWWYSARLPDDRVAVALMSDADLVSAKKLNQPESWLNCLQQTDQTRARLAGLAFTGEKLRVYPAQSFRLSTVSGSGWLATGDAACAYDPLSGQGIYKALRSGLTAAEAAAAFLQGDLEALPAYTARIVKQFDQYLLTRRNYYALEQRWPNSLFWQRR